MDFTSRWFIKNGTNEGDLVDIKARSIVPVDLNSIIYFNAKTLAEFHTKLGNSKIAAKYEYSAEKIYEVRNSNDSLKNTLLIHFKFIWAIIID